MRPENPLDIRDVPPETEEALEVESQPLITAEEDEEEAQGGQGQGVEEEEEAEEEEEEAGDEGSDGQHDDEAAEGETDAEAEVSERGGEEQHGGAGHGCRATHSQAGVRVCHVCSRHRKRPSRSRATPRTQAAQPAAAAAEMQEGSKRTPAWVAREVGKPGPMIIVRMMMRRTDRAPPTSGTRPAERRRPWSRKAIRRSC